MLISDNILVQTNTLLCEYILKTMPVCGYYIHHVPCIEVCFIWRKMTLSAISLRQELENKYDTTSTSSPAYCTVTKGAADQGPTHQSSGTLQSSGCRWTLWKRLKRPTSNNLKLTNQPTTLSEPATQWLPLDLTKGFFQDSVQNDDTVLKVSLGLYFRRRKPRLLDRWQVCLGSARLAAYP